MIWNVKCQHTQQQKNLAYFSNDYCFLCFSVCIFIFCELHSQLNKKVLWKSGQYNNRFTFGIYSIAHDNYWNVSIFFFSVSSSATDKKNLYNIERWWITFSIAGSQHSIEFHLIQYYFPLRYISFAIFFTIFSLLPFLCSHWYNIGSIFCGFFLNFSFFFLHFF